MTLSLSPLPCPCGVEQAWETEKGPRCYKCMTKSKRNKYGNVRTNGFDSAKEERRWHELQLLEQAGCINSLERQVRYVLSEKPRVSVVVDFQYLEAGQTVLEDVKGIDRRTGKPVTLTRAAKAKYAWLKATHGLEVRIV